MDCYSGIKRHKCPLLFNLFQQHHPLRCQKQRSLFDGDQTTLAFSLHVPATSTTFACIVPKPVPVPATRRPLPPVCRLPSAASHWPLPSACRSPPLPVVCFPSFTARFLFPASCCLLPPAGLLPSSTGCLVPASRYACPRSPRTCCPLHVYNKVDDKFNHDFSLLSRLLRGRKPHGLFLGCDKGLDNQQATKESTNENPSPPDPTR